MVEYLLPIAVGINLVVSLIILIVASSGQIAAQQARRALREVHERMLVELEQARLKHSENEQKAQQLEEERPEKLEWKLQHLTEELEQLRRIHSETQRQLGEQKQDFLHQAEQQEQQQLRLEQERQHLMEELERWHARYIESQQQIERLKQERLEDQQKGEKLAWVQERLLAELREIDKTTSAISNTAPR